MSKRRLLYLEDEPVIRENFSELFSNSGYTVLSTGCAEEAKACIEADEVLSAAVFDVSIGNDPYAGIELVKDFRSKHPLTPLILLTAHTDTPMQEMAFQLGADAYIDKNQPLSLLLVRLNALVARFGTNQATMASFSSSSKTNLLQFDEKAEYAFFKGVKLNLSISRYRILRALYFAESQILSLEELTQVVGGVVEPNTIVQHVKLTRDELRKVDPECEHLQTVRGRGYRWV